jgi:hypothetical protein
MRENSVTEMLVGFPDLISAQVFWASLEEPEKFHIVRIHNGALDGKVLAYLVTKNEE